MPARAARAAPARPTIRLRSLGVPMTNQPVDRSARSFTRHYLDQLRTALGELPVDKIATLIGWMKEARDQGRQIFVVGNGGSATTASHFATDIGKGASLDKPTRFRILSLTDNNGWMTALGNDLAYEAIFVEQLKNFARPGDLLVAISVSGNSPNVVKAVEWARQAGCRTVGLVGAKGGRVGELADLAIHAPTDHFGRAEDAHLVVTHIAGYFFIEDRD